MCKPVTLLRIARALIVIVQGRKVTYFIGGENETQEGDPFSWWERQEQKPKFQNGVIYPLKQTSLSGKLEHGEEPYRIPAALLGELISFQQDCNFLQTTAWLRSVIWMSDAKQKQMTWWFWSGCGFK